MKKSIFILFIIIPLYSCTSLPQSEQGIVRDIPMQNISEKGVISDISYTETSLVVRAENKQIFEIDFSVLMQNDLESIKSSLENYYFKKKFTPDGMYKIMELSDKDKTSVWIGDGIRSGMGPEGLRIRPDSDNRSLILESEGGKWVVEAEKETSFRWQNEDWIVYASNITIGELQDQPPFAADIVILRQ